MAKPSFTLSTELIQEIANIETKMTDYSSLKSVLFKITSKFDYCTIKAYRNRVKSHQRKIPSKKLIKYDNKQTKFLTCDLLSGLDV